MAEKKKNELLYQIIKGDNFGEYVYETDRITENDVTYILFDNGTKMNAALNGEFFEQVNSTNDGWVLTKERIVDIKTEEGMDKKMYEIPGPDHGKMRTVKKRKPPTKRNIKKPIKPVVTHTEIEVKKEPIKIESDPVILLLEKSKKKLTQCTISLNIDMITPELFNVINSSFENGDEKILDYIISNINMDELKSQLKDKLKNIYENE